MDEGDLDLHVFDLKTHRPISQQPPALGCKAKG